MSLDERSLNALVERLSRVSVVALNSQLYSPSPPTSFAFYASQMYKGVQVESFPQLATITFDSTQSEEAMNADIWPMLTAGGAVPDDDIVVINTERHPWLPCTTEEMNDLKPDFVVVHRAFFVPVPGAGELTGRVHSLFVDQVLAVNEGKTTSSLNGDGKGRLMRYLHHLRIVGMREVKGLLYNGTDLHYVWMEGDRIARVAESKWPDDDSFSLLRSWSVPYRYPPMTEALIKLCACFRVQVDCGTSGAVLGKGGFGSVFRVKRQSDGCLFALKVVLTDNSRIFQEEVHCMQTAFQRSPSVVVPIVEGAVTTGFLHDGYSFYGGYLMGEIGKPTTKNLSTRLTEVFLALQSLHDKQIAHRDARIQNVVWCGRSSPKFIDFRSCGFDAMCTLDTYRADMVCLIDSIFKLHNIAATAQEMNAMARSYDPTVSRSSGALVDYVTKKWQETASARLKW